MAINMPTRYGVSTIITKLQIAIVCYFNFHNALQVAEVSHYMDGIATVIFQGKSIVKSVDLAHDVLYNEVRCSLIPTTGVRYNTSHIVLMQAMVLLLQRKYTLEYNAAVNAHLLEEIPR